jgi:hypothetical protein
MDESFLLTRSARPGEAGYANRYVRTRSFESAFRHRSCHDFRDRIVAIKQVAIDTEQFVLRIIRICHEAAIEAVARSLDVGQQGSQHSAGAAFGRRNRQTLVAEPVHEPLGLRIQMVWKGRL